MSSSEDVLLGVCDAVITQDRVSTNWETNKIGGKPDLMFECEVPVCELCHGNQTLVCQIYAPLGGSSHHRTLYIYGCTRRGCWNKHESWSVLRSQCLAEGYSAEAVPEKTQAEPSTGAAMVTDDWGVAADDWGSDDDKDSLATSQQQSLATNEVTPEEPPFSTPAIPDEENTNLSGLNEMTATMFIDDVDDDTLSQSDVSGDDARHCIGEDSIDPQSVSITGYLRTEDSMNPQSGSNLQCDSEVKSQSIITGESEMSDNVSDNVTCDRNPVNNSSVSSSDKNESCDQNSASLLKSGNKEVETPEFCAYYVNVLSSSEVAPPGECEGNLKHEKRLLREYAQREGVGLAAILDQDSSSAGGGSGEGYEKTSVKHGDKAFYNFTKTLSQCPQQVLRYQYNGSPLYITRAPAPVKAPPCENCGQHRQFELQLMPGLCSVLRGHRGQALECEFGTVLVYTCSQSCWEDGERTARRDGQRTARREYVYVQPDPDQHLFKS